VTFPFGELELENRLKDLQIALLLSGGRRRRVLSPEAQKGQNFGRALFDALFAGEVRENYVVSRQEAQRTGKGLRLRLRFQPPELAVLPWEFLYDPRQDEFITLSRSTSLVRYPAVPQPVTPLAIAPPLRILGMVASPRELAVLDVDREKQRIERALAEAQADGLVELNWVQGQRWRDLQREMRRGPWHVLHFIGHGGFDPVTAEGFIALADSQGRVRLFGALEPPQWQPAQDDKVEYRDSYLLGQ